MRITPVKRIWLDGKLADWDDAVVHVLSPTVQYGWGVYEGIRCYATPRHGRAVFRLADHLRRLENSARIYAIPLPCPVDVLEAAVKDTIRENELESCYIRPVVYMEPGEMGVDPTAYRPRCFIAAWPWDAVYGEGVLETGIGVTISSWTRPHASAAPSAAKACGNYLNSCAARGDAVRAGFHEAILLNPAGTVADACVANVFCVTDGRVTTPPTADGPLPGITRASVLTLAAEAGHQVAERSLTRGCLSTADEVFLTSTAGEVVPVTSVDHRPVGAGRPGPVTLDLAARFAAAVRGEDDGGDRTDGHGSRAGVGGGRAGAEGSRAGGGGGRAAVRGSRAGGDGGRAGVGGGRAGAEGSRAGGGGGRAAVRGSRAGG
ncbi:branched-chain amino acid transaminase, partial [Streptomyces sp. NPDC059786]|uniref:branched-chain amino acid transaminase n=1 Tax=Streptomyces sp. NPDC059786 TaxID=3346946 RepID=UPI0036576C19